ncbi:MAG TPA: PLP-dependent aminotransferase family protein [Chloroflexota bacterium]|nr:PLP-dependent aminotransferase family protein [Chloroflexota bacterium]
MNGSRLPARTTSLDFEWRPDPSSAVPLFRQLVQHVRGQIVNGSLAPGTQLPAQRALAERLGVNRSTIVAAYQELQADGLIAGRAGGGTVVCVPQADDEAGAGTHDWQDLLDRGAFVHDRSLAAEVAQARLLPATISLAQGELAASLRPTAPLQELFRAAPVSAEWLGYEDAYGYQPLREAIAAHMARRGVSARRANVLIVAGAQQGLYLICRGLLQPGDTVIVEAPSYLLTLGVLQMAGVRILRAPLDQYGLIPDRLEELLARHRVAMVFTVPAYQNPTGAVLATARRAALLRLCERYRVPLVEDDVYGELGFDGAAPVPLYALDQGSHVIYVSSLSKSVAPGLRTGWLLGPPHLIKRLAEMKYQMHYGSSMVPQWVAQQWLEGGDHDVHLVQVRRALRERRDVLERELRAQLGSCLSWLQPGGGFHLWARVRAPISSTDLFRQALRAGVSIKPGSLYGVPARACWIRLSFQHAAIADLRVAPRILRAVIDELASVSGDAEGWLSDAAGI